MSFVALSIRRVAALVIFVLISNPAAASGQSVAEVVDRYMALNFDQEFEALGEVYAQDAVFFDPTGDVFNGPVADGPIVGADRIIGMQRSWGLVGAEWDVRRSWIVGEYSITQGTLSVTYAASGPWIDIPLTTVLRVQDGRVTERTDFGEYIGPFGLQGFDEATASTREVADAYLEAYLGGDVEGQVALVSEDVAFQDPTSRIYGGESGLLYRGVDELERRRRQIYQGITSFDLEVEESHVGNHHAVYIGTTSYTLRSGARFEQPAIFVIEVRDGRVTRHWDYVDYTIGPVG